MTWFLCTVLALWLAPIAWVVRANIRARRAYGQKSTPRYVAQQAWRLLAWPLGIIDAARGK